MEASLESNHGQANKLDVSNLPKETLDFAHRMFDAARKGDADAESSAALLQAIGAGLPVNLTNDKGGLLANYT